MPILAKSPRRISLGRAFCFLLLAKLVSCTSPSSKRVTQPQPSTQAPTASKSKKASSPASRGLSESVARRYLDRLFRQQGLRILNDQPLDIGEFTLSIDGWDPQREIGYEYIAEEERQLWQSYRTSLEGKAHQILLLDVMEEPALDAQAKAFLSRVMPK